MNQVPADPGGALGLLRPVRRPDLRPQRGDPARHHGERRRQTAATNWKQGWTIARRRPATDPAHQAPRELGDRLHRRGNAITFDRNGRAQRRRCTFAIVPRSIGDRAGLHEALHPARPVGAAATRPKGRAHERTQQSGFTMIEVLVTIAILVVGLLGLAAMQTLATAGRARGLPALAGDRAGARHGRPHEREQGATSTATSTATSGRRRRELRRLPRGTPSASSTCASGTTSSNGASEKTDGGTRNVGAMIGARGCVVPSSTRRRSSSRWPGRAFRAPAFRSSRAGRAPTATTRSAAPCRSSCGSPCWRRHERDLPP